MRLVLLFGWGGLAAWAVSCESRTVCERFAESDGVLLGEIVATHRDDKLYRVQYLVQVEERFKGVGPGETHLLVEDSFAYPGLGRARAGDRKLIYLHKSKEADALDAKWLADWPGRERLRRWITGPCSGNRSYSKFDPVLLWLRDAMQQKGGAELMGEVLLRPAEIDDYGVPDGGATVRLVGKSGRYEAVSREDGQFRITGVAGGTYELWAESERGLRSGRQTVEVRGALCERRTIVLPVKGAISGQVWLADGRPAQGLPVEAVVQGPDGQLMNSAFATVMTDELGRYQLEAIPGGRYLVGVGIVFYATPDQPWETRLRQGQLLQTTAQWVTLREGQRAEGVNWTLPEPLPVKQVRVKLGTDSQQDEWQLICFATVEGEKRSKAVIRPRIERGEMLIPLIGTYSYRIAVQGHSKARGLVRDWQAEGRLEAGKEDLTLEWK